MSEKSYKKIMQLLIDNGYEAYLVGGACRDNVLNREIGDYDITTNCLPDETQKVFSDYKLVLAGLKHGTVGVIIDGEMIEVTTYRKESEYTDHRHPNNVSFTNDLKEDLVRRDFTINALCMDINDNVIDLVGGIEDIKNKVIRTVLSSEVRFEEDALRILRALRFSSTLQFEICEETKNAIFKKYHLLEYVSKERIHTEFKKMIVGKDFSKIFSEYFEVFCFLFDKFKKLVCPQNNPYHIYDVLNHTLVSLDYIENDYILKLAVLFHDIGKLDCLSTTNGIDHFYNHSSKSKEICEEFLNMYKFSNKDKKLILMLVEKHDYTFSKSIVKFKRMLSKLSKEEFIALMKVKQADDYSKNQDVVNNKNEEVLEKGLYIYDNEPLNLSDLDINGFEILKLGVSIDKISKTFYYLLDEVYLHPQNNKKEILQEIVLKRIVETNILKGDEAK